MQIELQAYEQINKRVVRCQNGQTDKRIDGRRADGQTNGWTDGRASGERRSDERMDEDR